MMLSYKYRLYPSKGQEEKLNDALELCRHVYNFLLDQLAFIRRDEDRIPDSKELQSLLPLLKHEFPEFRGVYSKVLQMVNHQLWSNLRALSRLKKNGKKIGRLRFKGEGGSGP